MVNLGPFFQAWRELQQEFDRLGVYTESATFWAAYDAKLRDSYGRVALARRDMETNSGWRSPDNPNAASSAFYARVDAGMGSIQKWLSGTAAVRDGFAAVARKVGDGFHAVDGHRAWLLSQDKVTGATAVAVGKEIMRRPVTAKITEQDGEITVPPDIAAEVDRRIAESLRLHGEVKTQFGDTVRALNTLQPEKWLGPTPAPAPDSQTLDVGRQTSNVRDGPGGGSGGGPGGAADQTGSGAATSQGEQGSPGDQAASDSAGEDKSGGPTGTDPLMDQPSTSDATNLGSVPDVPGSTSDLGEIPELPPSPELAGTPTATTPPPSGDLGLPSTLNNSPLPPASTVDRTPLPSTSTVDRTPLPLPTPMTGGPRGATGGSVLDRTGTRAAAEPSPSPARGGTSGSSSGTTSGGFIPPMGMFPPGGGGNRGGGVRPGEAEFAGGPMRQARGADTWRAGLQPHLLGRGGERDDEPRLEPPPGDDVLDDELWQVP